MQNEHTLTLPKVVAVFGIFSTWGVGIALMTTPWFWCGAPICYLAAGASIWLYSHTLKSSWRLKKLVGISIAEAIIFLIAVFVEIGLPSGGIIQHLYFETRPSGVPVTPLSMAQFFDSDHETDAMIVTMEPKRFTLPNGRSCNVVAKAVVDPRLQTYYAALFVPACTAAEETIVAFADQLSALDETIRKYNNFGVGTPGSKSLEIRNPQFTKKIILYFEDNLQNKQKGNIEDAYSQIGVSVIYNGMDELKNEMLRRDIQSMSIGH